RAEAPARASEWTCGAPLKAPEENRRQMCRPRLRPATAEDAMARVIWFATLGALLGSAGASAQDWTRFGWDAGRSSAPSTPVGITAANLRSLERQQVVIDGTVDAAAIYLHGAVVQGRTVDVFFVTTTYGNTLAIDARSGAILWEHTPPEYGSWAGSYRMTTATPVADPDRAHVYAASPDGRIQKLAVADGHVVWSTAITTLPRREKIASPLNYFRGRVIATTGNGPWDGRSDWGDAVLELDSNATRLLGNYTPVNTADLEARDADLGSTSPVLLGGNLIAQGGKDGSIRLLDWGLMRGTTPHQ